jgi:hypothetical protein
VARIPWRSGLLWSLGATLICGVMVVSAGPDSDRDFPRLFENAAVALQGARNAEEVRMIAGEPGEPTWQALRRQTMFDFLLAGAYGAVFALAGRRLRWLGSRWGAPLGWTAISCGMAAAAFDWAENVATLQHLGDPVTFSPVIGILARLKWAAIGIATLAAMTYWFPPLPIDTEKKAFGAFAAFLFLNAAALALAGVVWPLAWERFGLPFAGALLVCACLTIGDE